MSATEHETMANGIRIKSSLSQPTAVVRSLAAAIGRDHDAVDRICSSVAYDATVWLSRDVGDGGERLDMPDGYRVANTFVSSNGEIGLRVEREGDR